MPPVPNRYARHPFDNWHERESHEPMLFAGMSGLWLRRIAEEPAVDPQWLNIAT